MQFTLRPAIPADQPAIERLIFGVLREYGLQPDPSGTDADLHDVEGVYHRAGGRFDVLVDRHDALFGTVALGPVTRTTVELRKMYLHRSLRGQGFGRQLLEHALREASSLGFSRVVLETASVLREAIALYERFGFHRCRIEHLAPRCDLAFQLELPSTFLTD